MTTTTTQALEPELHRLREIARLIGSIFVHGGFVAETHNERELEKLLREQGTFWTSLAEYDAAIEADRNKRALPPAANWRPIETAPLHTEVIVWREDSGAFLARKAAPCDVADAESDDETPAWLADQYGWQDGAETPTHWMPKPPDPCASQPKDEDEDAYLIDRLSKLLAGVAVALKGEELPRHRHSYHDLPEVAQTLVLERDLLKSQLEELRAAPPAQEAGATESPCPHDSGTAKHDHWACNDCGAVKPDTQWGIASRMWFASIAEAEFYKEHGRLPDSLAAQGGKK